MKVLRWTFFVHAKLKSKLSHWKPLHPYLENKSILFPILFLEKYVINQLVNFSLYPIHPSSIHLPHLMVIVQTLKIESNKISYIDPKAKNKHEVN